MDIKEINERIQRESAFVDLLQLELGKVIVGQKQMTERLLIAPTGQRPHPAGRSPGTGQDAFDQVVCISHSRQVQPDPIHTGPVTCRPDRHDDLQSEAGEFLHPPGTCSSPTVLADEINRAPAKVQSALLQPCRTTGYHRRTDLRARRTIPGPGYAESH